MLYRDHRDDRHIESFGFEGNIHNDFVDAAVGKKQKTIGWAEHKVAKNDLTKTFHVLEEHCLSLSVRADHEVMKGEGELDDGMETWKTSMPREHLLDENPRVPCAKQVDQSISRDGLRAKFSCAFDNIHLSRFDPIENCSGLRYIIYCCS